MSDQMTTTTDATTYITDDGDGPELWRHTEGENTQDQLLLTWGDLRAAMYHHKTGGPEYIADVDRLWDVIATTASEDAKP